MMSADAMPSEWITTKEAAKLTGYSAGYIRQLIARDRLDGQKLGRDWVLDKSEVLDYAHRMEQLGQDKFNPWRTGARKRASES